MQGAPNSCHPWRYTCSAKLQYVGHHAASVAPPVWGPHCTPSLEIFPWQRAAASLVHDAITPPFPLNLFQSRSAAATVLAAFTDTRTAALQLQVSSTPLLEQSLCVLMHCLSHMACGDSVDCISAVPPCKEIPGESCCSEPYCSESSHTHCDMQRKSGGKGWGMAFLGSARLDPRRCIHRWQHVACMHILTCHHKRLTALVGFRLPASVSNIDKAASFFLTTSQ